MATPNWAPPAKAALGLLCELASEPLNLLDAAGEVLGSSAAAAEYAGTQQGEGRERATFAETHPEDRPEAARAWTAALDARGLPVRTVVRLKHRSGEWRRVEARLRNLLADPRVEAMVISWREISESPQSELALRASEARYRLIAENAHDLIVRLEEGGKLLYVSPASQDVLGAPPERLVGTNYYDLVHPDDVEALRLTHAGASQALNAVPTYRCRRRDGSWVWLESNARALPSGSEGEVLVVARDITNRRRIEEQFLQAQKMSAIGRLAGGVAHDFNNLLSIISSAGTLLLDDLAVDHPGRPMAEEIRAACRRAAELTRHLLAFSRRQMLVAAPVNVNDVITGAIAALKLPPDSKIELVTQLDLEVGTTNIDFAQIEQVVVNMALNARDAMPNGGQLAFRTSNVSVTASDQDATPDTPVGDYVMIRVEDTGVGMDALTRTHLFEPFFTTKPRGKGVGLGLATAYGVVKQSNGHIRVSSAPGEGSSFSLLFPRVGPVVPAPSRPQLPRAVPGTETILLVEDDTAVRRVAAALLEKKGYRVVQAEDGQEALELARLEPQPVHLLLTDVMMPGMSGPEIAQALKAKWPRVRVLFMSGYTNDSVLRAGVESSEVNFLHKPFTLDNLSRRVREVLDQPV